MNLLRPPCGRLCGAASRATQVALEMHHICPSLHTPPTCVSLQNIIEAPSLDLQVTVTFKINKLLLIYTNVIYNRVNLVMKNDN